MKTYESIIITTPELPEAEEKALMDGMVAIINDRDGTLHINDRMGRRRLAYAIKKSEDGVYTRLLYDSESDVPREMERRLHLSDKVLRVMTVFLEKQWAVDARDHAVRLIAERAENARRQVEEAKLKAEEEAAAAAAPAVEEEPVAEEAVAAVPDTADEEKKEDAPVEVETEAVTEAVTEGEENHE